MLTVSPQERGTKRWRVFLWGGRREKKEQERKVFPLRASCYYSASGAEQREMSVLCLWDLTQNLMYTCRHAHTDTQEDWQQHINQMKLVKEENKHVWQSVRRTRSEAEAGADASDGRSGRENGTLGYIQLFTMQTNGSQEDKSQTTLVIF